MSVLLEPAPQTLPAIRRRFSIMATVDDRYLIVDDAGRPVPTVARSGVAAPARQSRRSAVEPSCSRRRLGSALTTRSYESSMRSRTS